MKEHGDSGAVIKVWVYILPMNQYARYTATAWSVSSILVLTKSY